MRGVRPNAILMNEPKQYRRVQPGRKYHAVAGGVHCGGGEPL